MRPYAPIGAMRLDDEGENFGRRSVEISSHVVIQTVCDAGYKREKCSVNVWFFLVLILNNIILF